MTTASKSRLRVKTERHVRISHAVNGGASIVMTIGSGPKAKHYGYYVRQRPADFGLAFHFEKFEIDKAEGEDSEYDVNLDMQRDYHSCTCKGNTYCGNCKHVESVLALIKRGKIAVPQQPAPEPIEFDDP